MMASPDNPLRPALKDSELKRKRMQKYRRVWEESNTWLESVSSNEYQSNCTICRRVFSVAHGCLSDVRQHASGEQHSRNARAQRNQSTVAQFFIPQSSPEADSVTAAELTLVYHTVKHNLSYNSANCGHKLNQKILHDSKIIKKMSLGKTKAEAMVKDILAPKAVADVVDILTSGKPLPFSIQTDASNEGNRKMFPLAVQYFRPETGICNKMLDFGENADESAGIMDYIEQSLDKFGLSLDQKKQKGLLEGNCHAHIVHNTVKHAFDQLTVDVENVVLKVYGHFSTSAK
ncbi:uncharacterized protein LOC113746684 [Tachysurus ichikawai]